jgi:peptidoglycan/LPS O-acetylase OafA/YrhL
MHQTDKSFFSIRPLPNHFPALHGLRAISAFGIIVYHITPRYFPGLINLWFLMDLFFVLSGFLIGLLLFHDFEQSNRNVLRFYFRRSIRIFPLYYFVLFSAAAIFGLSESQRANFWRELIYLTNYTMGNYSMNWSWSLSLDEHFYLLCPVLIFFLQKIPQRKFHFIILGLMWLSALIIRLIIFWQHKDSYAWDTFLNSIYYPTHTRYDTLIAGVTLACAVYYYPQQVKTLLESKYIQRVLMLVSACVFLFILLVPYIITDGSAEFGLIFCFSMGTLTSIGYSALFLYLIYVPSILAKFLSTRFFLVFATLSYGFYLVHLYVLRGLTRPILKYFNIDYPLNHDFFAWFSECALTLTLSYCIAYILHLLIEKPTLYFRDRYFN